MITIEATSECDNKWNIRLDSPYGNFFQTNELAQAKRFRGYEPLFLKFISETGKIKGQVLILTKSRFQQKNLPLKNIIRKFIPKNTIFEWVYGPIIFEQEYINEIKEAFYSFLTSKKCLVKGNEHPLQNNVFLQIESPFKKIKWCIFLLDLSLGKEPLWKNMDKHSVQKKCPTFSKTCSLYKRNEKNDYLKYRKLSISQGKNIYLADNEINSQWDLFI